jgi:hypothetical protein
MFTSFHRDSQNDESVTDHQTQTGHAYRGENDVQQSITQELDAVALACCKDVKSCPMTMAKVTNFFFWNPNPSSKELHEFTSTMSPSMKKHIEKIAHIIALHPELSLRLEALATEESGMQLRYNLGIRDYQNLAVGYLRDSQSPHFPTVRDTLVERQRTMVLSQIRTLESQSDDEK